jgi:hypothetical protein
MKNVYPTVVTMLAVLACACATAEFRYTEENGRLTLYEDDAPVFVYNMRRVDPPEGVDAERYWRASYIHPLYGLDGTIITDDFPKDHYHHRGVWWSWPECRFGDRKMDTWTVVGVRQLFEHWTNRIVTADTAQFAFDNAWVFDDSPTAVIGESVDMVVHAAKDNARAVDFRLRFTNVSDKDVVFEGAKNKGYGGLNFRPIAENEPLTIVAKDGVLAEDSLRIDTPWAAMFWTDRNTQKRAGIAIFQHPDNPDYPHDGWILRHYGLIGAAWPHEREFLLKPGDHFELQYRLVVFLGEPVLDQITAKYKAYQSAPPEIPRL